VDKRYQDALNAALTDIAADHEVVGIVFTGSIQQGRPGPTSDLDLYVVTHKDHYWRDTREYQGVKAELFINTVASMKWRITRPDEIAAMAGFATGEILLDRTGEVAALQAVAKERWEAGPQAPSPEQVDMLRYHLCDLMEDLQDVEPDPVAACLVGHDLVVTAIKAFCRLNRYWGDKPKRLVGYVAERDPLLGEMLRDYYGRGQHPHHALEVAEYVLAPVGGPLKLWQSSKVKYQGGA
jgi:predicted nucleotidyltransferase